jgi:excisionase family DNA binding protein
MEGEEFMPAMTVAEVASKLGVTASAVRNWIDNELCPAEKVGRNMCIEEGVVDSIGELRDEYGKAWAKHAPWNGAEPEADESEKKGGGEVPGALNSQLLALAKKYRSAGHESIACQLYDVVLDQYDF